MFLWVFRSLLSPLISFSAAFERDRGNLGCIALHIQLPSIAPKSKVLDVGAGDGTVAQRMRDTFSADVYALEPNTGSILGFESCVEKLGSRQVKKLTLQEALTQYPDDYTQAFDVACVFKYCVPAKDKEDFIKFLSQTIKLSGVVYITSVEWARVQKEESNESLYLIDTCKKYFENVSWSVRKGPFDLPQDVLITLRSPYPWPSLRKIDLSGGQDDL
ncbi:MAG: class I SAM-dependent methyltransferase [Alphaproteobacteria bacterium]